MPLFEYRCDKCGHVFEHLAMRSDERPSKCPQCGSRKLEKQFSAFSARTGPDGSDSSCTSGTCSTGTCPLS
ncbi:MAG TPA: zinc ribbon domain-containing protein [Kiritimatiellae bacterium]|nr:zinc ribbon domain-containing protein [Kiritimatiellia bacterium]